MRIGIISDTHDHLQHLDQVREALVNEEIDSVIHCGDLCAPFMVDELEKFQRPVDVVFGNIDDRHLTTRKADASEHVRLHGDMADITLDDCRIGVTHFPDIARAMSFTQRFDLVCFGHTHKTLLERVGPTTLLNPGEIMGRLGSVSYAVFDTSDKSVQQRQL